MTQLVAPLGSTQSPERRRRRHYGERPCPSLEPASLERRATAFLLDALLIGFLSYLTYLLVMEITGFSPRAHPWTWYWSDLLLKFVVPALYGTVYLTVCVSLPNLQVSFGGLASELRVVRSSGYAVRWPRALCRSLLLMLPMGAVAWLASVVVGSAFALPAIVAFGCALALPALFDDRRRHLIDHLLDTQVVCRF